MDRDTFQSGYNLVGPVKRPSLYPPAPNQDCYLLMTGRTLDNPFIFRHLMYPILVLMALWIVASPSIALAIPERSLFAAAPLAQTQNIPVRNPNPSIRVEDPGGVLTAQQFQRLNADLDRLARLGTESVVFYREHDDDATSQAWLAEDLRLAWGVESTVGARDGLVVVVSVDRADPINSTIDTSSGRNTFPIRQLSNSGFDSLVESVALPELQTGDAFSGIQDLMSLTLGTVIDRAGVLTERQLVTLDNDLRRLGQLGLPTLVYVHSTSGQNDDQALANSLLGQWAPGSGEQPSAAMVLVISVDPDNAENSSMAYAASEGSFPIRQLTIEGYESILANEAQPALETGDVYLSLAYAIRRTINYAEYSPPEPAPLSDVQRMFQEPLNVVAAVLVQFALLLYFLIPAIVDRRLTLIPSPRAMAIYVVVTIVLAGGVGVLAIMDRNRAATLAALAVVVLAAAVLPLVRAGLGVIVQLWLSTRETSTDSSGTQGVTDVN